MDDFDSFRHVTIDVNAPGLTRDDLLNGKAPCYITCFSEAHADHQCMRTVPVLPLGSYLPRKEVKCDEVSDVLFLLDFMKEETTPVAASDAIAWHVKYSKLHPDADNMDVLIAQRARLYPTLPSVYGRHLEISFEDEVDEYSKAIILRTATDSDEEQELTPDRLLSICSDSESPEPDASPLEAAIDKLRHATLENSTTPFKV